MARILLFIIFLSIQLFTSAQSKVVVGYLPTYRFANYNSIDYCKLTHLNICFANPDSEGNIRIDDFSSIINSAKEQNPDIVVCISLGGGGLSESQKQIWANFVDIPSNRPALITNIINFVELHNLGGVDFDLEWDAVTVGYSEFVIDLNDSLKNYDKIFTAALPASYRYPQITNGALAVFDFINIMAYDQTGPWQPNNPGQHSSYRFAESAVNYWILQGLPPEKLTLGVPFYGYNFEDKNDVFAFTYSTMVSTSTSYADIDQVGEAYYNGRPTIDKKVELSAQNTGGIMIWEIGQDRFDDYSLLSVIHNKFNSLGYITTGLCGNTVFAKTIHIPEIKIYPNPASNNLYIEFNSEIEYNVSIYDLLGRRLNILPNKRLNKLVLNVSGLKKGFYLVKVESPYFNRLEKIAITGISY